MNSTLLGILYLKVPGPHTNVLLPLLTAVAYTVSGGRDDTIWVGGATTGAGAEVGVGAGVDVDVDALCARGTEGAITGAGAGTNTLYATRPIIITTTIVKYNNIIKYYIRHYFLFFT